MSEIKAEIRVENPKDWRANPARKPYAASSNVIAGSTAAGGIPETPKLTSGAAMPISKPDRQP